MRLLSDKVMVVLEDAIKEKGGIIIPERAEKVNQWGRVSYTGGKCVEVEPGDSVMIGANSGTRMRRDNVSLVVLSEGEILCKEE